MRRAGRFSCSTIASHVGHKYEQPIGRVFGYAMGHEIGHLVLPPPAHSPDGIMRPDWDGADIRHASDGSLRFTLSQRDVIRGKLSACCVSAANR